MNQDTIQQCWVASWIGDLQTDYCMQTILALSSRDESLILTQIQVYEHSRTPLFFDSWSSTVASCTLKLKCHNLSDMRVEFQGSNRDCQVTFECYCKSPITTQVTRSCTLLL